MTPEVRALIRAAQAFQDNAMTAFLWDDLTACLAKRLDECIDAVESAETQKKEDKQ